MSGKKSMSRRAFVAGASGVLLAGTAVGADEKAASSGGPRLAIDGGERFGHRKREHG